MVAGIDRNRVKHTTMRNLRSHAGTLTSLAFLLAIVCSGTGARAVNCTPQAEMQSQDRDALIAAANPLAVALVAQNFDLLQSSLLPAVTGDWDAIRSGAQAAAPVLKGGQVNWRSSYLLDATDLKATEDTQFFCVSPDNSSTVTVGLRSLPPGRYALMIGDFPASALQGQLAFILGYDSTKWKLGGLFVREGALGGHDGVWYWTHARELANQAQSQPWAAWFSYDTARLLLLPVDFVSSPNLEKLNREQSQLKANPPETLPLKVSGDAGASWRITALRIDTTLHDDDLALTYEGTGQMEPRAARAEAIAVMSAFLKLHPELRTNFHGLWAYAEKDGRQSFAIEQAMHDIP